MKKVISVLLIAVMVMSVACKKKETTTATTQDTTTQTTTEAESTEEDDLLRGKLQAKPGDEEAGKLTLVQPVEAGNIRISEFARTTKAEKLSVGFVVGQKETITVKYQAKEASKLSIYIFQVAGDYRWKKSTALASATVDVAAADKDTEAALEFTIPEGTQGGNYAFVFVENDSEVVGYYQGAVLEHAGDMITF